MKNTPAHRLVRLATAIALSAGASLSAATGVASAAPAEQPATILVPFPFPSPHAAGGARAYYENYFYSYASCVRRGEAIVTPGRSGHIPGAIGYVCFKKPGDTKWSMRITWR